MNYQPPMRTADPPPHQSGDLTRFGYQQELRRSLGLRDLLAYGDGWAARRGAR